MTQQSRTPDSTALFLCGADMDPTLIRQHYPQARFIARARLAVASGVLPWHPLAADPAVSEIWGIALAVPSTSPATTHQLSVETDDGETLPAVLGTDAATVGEPAAVLACARYWELAPAFVRRLQIAVGDREPAAPVTTGD